MAVSISDLVGTWDMVHDDWRGTLVVRPPGQRFNEVDGPCTYSYYAIGGTYTGGDGSARTMQGRFGGRDLNKRTNEQCKQSDHKVSFTIAFPNEPPQPFDGYLYTHTAFFIMIEPACDTRGAKKRALVAGPRSYPGQYF